MRQERDLRILQSAVAVLLFMRNVDCAKHLKREHFLLRDLGKSSRVFSQIEEQPNNSRYYVAINLRIFT